MGNIPVTEAHLLGLFLASILYGFHLTTYAFCMEHLLFSSTRAGRGWAMFTISTL
ncbi:hypothetical protein CPC08DRAFT_715549 [Agrocybe pediades]|nr:hypothetical protein CPC08DRAFT_715549 [Agrocybe pediades]